MNAKLNPFVAKKVIWLFNKFPYILLISIILFLISFLINIYFFSEMKVVFRLAFTVLSITMLWLVSKIIYLIEEEELTQ